MPKFLLVLLLLLFSSFANSAFLYGTGEVIFDSPQAACAQHSWRYYNIDTNMFCDAGWTRFPIYVSGHCSDNETQLFDSATGYSCISNNPTNPTCTPPQVLNPTTNQCETPKCTRLKNTTVNWFNSVSTSADQCVDGCNAAMFSGTCGQNQAGKTGCFMSGTYDGTTCTATSTQDTPPPNDPAFDCIKAGKSYGTVNGQTICLPKTASGAAPLTTNSTGSTATTTTNTTASGASTSNNTNTSTTINSTNNTVTTTTTTTNPDGSKTVDTKKQDMPSFCTQNPNSTVCKDAVDPCTLHPERDSCKDTKSGDPASTTPDDIYKKTSTDSDFKNAVDGFSTKIKSSGWYSGINGFFNVTVSGGSCSGMDNTFTFMNTSFNVNLSSIFCSSTADFYYQILSIGLLLVASFTAFKWAFY